MTNIDLEKLLSKHIRGSLSFMEYRQKRQSIVRSYTDGETPELTIPNEEETTQSIKPVEIKNTKLEIPTIVKTEGIPSSRYVQLAVITLLLFLAILAWYTSRSTGELESAPSLANSTKEKLTNPETQQRVITNEKYITDFLAQNHWDAESLSNFLLWWQALPRERQANIRNSETFKQLVNQMKQKMRTIEQQKQAGNKSSDKEEKLIIWFATQLSIGIF